MIINDEKGIAMEKIIFNENWLCVDGGGCVLETLVSGTPEKKTIMLPHDASIERPRKNNPIYSGTGFFEPVNCHYTKEFFVDEKESDQVFWLEFEGVYQNAFVYVNDSYAGKCFYGYSNFCLDITRFLHFGKNNKILVVVKNGVASGRWYTGSGIYRNVFLRKANRMHLTPEEIQFSVEYLEKNLAVVKAKAEISYQGCGTRQVQLLFAVSDEKGQVIAKQQVPVTVLEFSKESYVQKLYIDDPRYWSLEKPHLYRYCVEIREAETGELLDCETGTFGIRSIQADPRNGLRLNGKRLKLRGGCIHQDQGILGAVVFYEMEERRVRKLKEAGYNCLRSAHHPASRELLQACDRLGMLVMDEFSDVWTSSKVDFDYGMHMSECWETDVERMVKKDFNHPCVIMYSIGNEIMETGNRMDAGWGKRISDKIRELDPGRLTLNSINITLSVMNRMQEFAERVADGREKAAIEWELPQEPIEINDFMNNNSELSELLKTSDFAGKATEEAFSQVDIAGYNYGTCRYEMDGRKYPNRILVGSETFPSELDKNWELVEKLDYLIGDFSWTAWEYLGESGIGRGWYGTEDPGGFYAAYPWKMGYCGDFNLIGDRRPVSYWREIIWGLRDKPYIAVHDPGVFEKEYHTSEWGFTNAIHSWNWSGREGMPVRVEVYAPGEEVELFVNGASVGRKKAGTEKKAVTVFETAYIPGKIEAAAYSNGREIGRQILETADDNVQLSLDVERSSLRADAMDIGLIEICLRDERGRWNKEASKQIHVKLEGPGLLQGIGSGDPKSEETFQGDTVRTFEGKALLAVRTTRAAGEIIVTAETEDGLKQSVSMISV